MNSLDNTTTNSLSLLPHQSEISPSVSYNEEMSLHAVGSTLKQLKKEFSNINDISRLSAEDYQKKVFELRASMESLPDSVVGHME